MTAQNLKQTKQPIALLTPILIGAGVGLILISFFVFGVNPRPEWGKLWMIQPLVICPLAGATGGAFYWLMDYQSARGFNRTLAITLSLIVFVIGLWLGLVLGLHGTMWH